MQILNSPGKCKYQIGVYKCDKILHSRLHDDFRKYNNNFFFIVPGLTTIRETLKNRNITTDARAPRTRHALHEDSCDTEEGSGEEVPVAIWEALTAVRTLIQFLKFHKRTAESEDRKWMSGVLVNLRKLRGGPLGEADPWSGTDQNNRLLYE